MNEHMIHTQNHLRGPGDGSFKLTWIYQSQSAMASLLAQAKLLNEGVHSISAKGSVNNINPNNPIEKSSLLSGREGGERKEWRRGGLEAIGPKGSTRAASP